jgi:hypothetical protein
MCFWTTEKYRQSHCFGGDNSQMDYSRERRREGRISFTWPLWFGYQDNGQLYQGRVQDLSRTAVSFTVARHLAPPQGTHVMTRFSFPVQSENFEMGSYLHWSEVLRVEPVHGDKVKVAMRLHQPLCHTLALGNDVVLSA